jgi:small subunit ribosomal protein S17
MTVKKYKEMTGTVLRRSGDKTVAVVVTRVERHPVYEKRRTRKKTYLTHDPNNTAQVGDEVIIRATRPLSARKRWVIVVK